MKTALRLLWPPSFWRAITMEMPVRRRRLFWSALATAGVGYAGVLLFHVFGMTVGIAARWLRARTPVDWYDNADFYLSRGLYFPLGSKLVMSEPVEQWGLAIVIGLVLAMAIPVGMLPSARRVRQMRQAWLFRGVACLLIGMLTLHGVRLVMAMLGTFVLGLISQRYAMIFGMFVVPLTCSPVATAALLLFYGVSMWAAFVLLFLRQCEGRVYVWLCWVVGSLAACCIWGMPWLRGYLNLY